MRHPHLFSVGIGRGGVFLTLIVALSCALQAQAVCKQPAYAVVHRCNDPNMPANAVKEDGVNAIEADFSWGRPTVFDDRAWYVEHDIVTAFSTEISDWLPKVKAEIDRPGTTLGLVFIDIKDPTGPLDTLYHQLRRGLGPQVHLLFSIPNWDLRTQFDQIKNLLNDDPRAGAAIDFLVSGQSMQMVQDYFVSAGITKYWYGDGYNAAVPTPASVRTNMLAAATLRDGTGDCAKFHGIYTWTYETDSSFNEFYSSPYAVNGLFANSAQCFGYAFPLTADSPRLARDRAAVASGRFFATPDTNPFEHEVPSVAAPSNITVECSAAGGSPSSFAPIATFLSSASVGGAPHCDDVRLADDSPAFFPLDARHDVTFSARDGSTPCAATGRAVASVLVKDTIAPAIACPANISADPVSPEGRIVSFTAAAVSDTCDPSVVAVCPASGNTFPVGSLTSVGCTVQDQSLNAAACSTFVKVFSAAEVVANLQAATSSLPLSSNLKSGDKASLLAILADVLTAIEASSPPPGPKPQVVCKQLAAFIVRVKQLLAKKSLTADQAAPLLLSAGNLQGTYLCPV